jgi:two-component system chemotaxis response regulator CheY
MRSIDVILISLAMLPWVQWRIGIRRTRPLFQRVLSTPLMTTHDSLYGFLMTSNPRAKKILIVDDSKVSRMVIRAHVKQRHPDWEVLEADSGDKALIVADQETPDYCTMDINMPGIIGTDAAELILKKHPAMRIVIFSANIQQTHQLRAESIQTCFVAKPVTDKSIEKAFNYFLSGVTNE